MDNVLNQEREKLRKILESYKEVIKYTEESIKSLPNLYKDNPDLLYNLLNRIETKLINLNKCLDKPYFARIDFTNEDNKKKDICYIGKVGVLDPDNNIITVDWRAPISSLYYDSNIGKTSYDAPEGNIKGSLDLKRQIEIENGELLSFFDVDTVSNDELLKPYLGVNADNRLKNIVSSIQSEQNAIIREKLQKNIIVQGVAGSGKTTVALHRIAYLVYNNRDKINSNQYMVIGPNKLFINYISSVLPDLDVTNVSQLTYEELTHDFLDEDFKVIDSSHNLLLAVEKKLNVNVEKIKTSLLYKQAIDKYIRCFEKTLIPNKDFSFKDFNILSENVIRKVYYQVNEEYPNYDLQSKINKSILLLGKIIENNYDHYISKLGDFTHQQFIKNKDKREDVIKIQKDFESIKKELGNNCKQSLKKYFSKIDTKILMLYKNFIFDIDNYIDIDTDTDCLKKNTLQTLKEKEVSFEDLAALLYLKYKVKGIADYNKYRHVVIDEAQDLGEFNFYVLNKIMNKAIFSIFGDIAQSIYAYRGIENWDNVKMCFTKECEVIELLKSYRTTIEIMEAANNVTDHLGLNKAEPVIRHGSDVVLNKMDKMNSVNYIYNRIIDFVNKGYKSIAVISKTYEEADYLNMELRNLGLNVNHISDSKELYEGGICTIPSYLAKGLEFDAVILENVSENNYSSKQKLDMRLLYVSMTRSLHELDMIYYDDITEPLSMIKKHSI